MTGKTADAVVIGSGVIGCSIAYELARKSLRTCVVDRAAGPGQGSTSASSAVVRFNYSTWNGVAAAWESKHRWESWEDYLQGTDDGELARFHRTGGLWFPSPVQNAEGVLRLFDRAGVPYEQWDEHRMAAEFPQIDTGRYFPPVPVSSEEFWKEPTGAVACYWTPDAGFVDDPQFAAHNLMAAAVRCGTTFRYKSQVTGITVLGDRVRGVTLADGSHVDAPVVVNAGGPHSARINAMAGVLDDLSVSTRPLRQEVHEVPGVGRDEPSRRPWPVMLDLDLGTYSRGTPADRIIVGGTEPACDPLQWLDDPDDCGMRPSAPVYEAQAYRLARRVPDLAVPNRPSGVVGVYDVSDDWIPVYDRTSLPGFYVAIGTSGNQFKNAPVVGELMAEIIVACEGGRDHDTRPVEVALERTGHVVDLAHYSRRRPVNRSSSFSVMG
jgi:glycine/D-amino acid oxidase-like deaminating enzyme